MSKKNQTFSARAKDVAQKWYLVDASDKVLGRLATSVAKVLRGKNKSIFTPHVDTGDFVVVVNAEKIKITGNKAKQKTYFRHSGYPGGAKTFTFEKMLEKNPERIIREAVWGMMPKGRLGAKLIKKLKIYVGTSHPHKAQNPTVLE